ncbi:uncharacterized protein [Nicotiana tomentosiformis]|uniref:uncharacterized protein n=1 Tax=Nicotiana tomentosiformis TaxID=4098 RepID=UPI00388C4242
MVKTSQTILQKEKASSSQSVADETLVEPRPEDGFLDARRSSRSQELDAVLRPSSIEEEASASVPKPVKDNKRKRASAPEDPKSKKRTACKPKKNTIPLTVESVLHLRDKDGEEEEENNGSVLAARMKKSIDSPKAAESTVIHKFLPRTKEMSEEGSGKVPESLEVQDASYRSQQMVGTSEGTSPEVLRTEENAPSESPGAIVIGDSPTLPAFSEGAIREAQTLGALEMSRSHEGEDPFCDLFTGVEDVAGPSDMSSLLYEAVAVHREVCSRSQVEMHRFETDLQRVTKERNSIKLILGQRGEEIKDLQAELAKAHQDQTDLTEQLQQKIEMIGKLREEVDVIKVEYLKCKEGMDCFAAEKEAARAQLSSTENQLQSIKEKSSVQAKADADAFVAVYWADAEAAQVQAREAAETTNTRAHLVAELVKCRSRRDTLEEIHARGFDLTEEIKRAKKLEANAEALVSDDDDDGSKNGSDSREDPDGEETAPGDNQET